MRNRFSLSSAFAAAQEDALPLWVGDFLASRGSDNEILAAALSQKRHWWLGPIRLPTEDLVRLAGPEDEALVPIDEEEWEDDVDAMEESLESGWHPPPLLVEYQDGKLLLQDGNHRFEALVRAGEEQAWTLVMFESPEDRETFRATLGDRAS
jgi:hypothetical protein